ncbi:MAG: hypothetical protein MZV63_58015 [Marinilabiliales bacterium]|nr:hypothetical protein [Marinilabiliales bacterium]
MTYSMNKEDIWVSSVPVPVTSEVNSHVRKFLTSCRREKSWNSGIYILPLWAQAAIEKKNGRKVLALCDNDPFDFAKAERVFPAFKNGMVEFTLMPAQNNNGRVTGGASG